MEWVKGHSGIQGNEYADEVAREAGIKARDKDSFISHGYLERVAKERKTKCSRAVGRGGQSVSETLSGQRKDTKVTYLPGVKPARLY